MLGNRVRAIIHHVSNCDTSFPAIFQIHIVNELLRSMDTGVDIEFVTYKQYGNLLMDVMEAIEGNLEFALSYKEGKKGFSTYEITEVFELE